MANIQTSKLSFTRRLQRATKAWDKMMEPMLDHRKKMFIYYASGYYGDEDSRKWLHILNLIDRGVSILVPFLAGQNPKVLVSSKPPQLRGWAYTSQLALNHLLQELDASKTCFRPAVRNSLFGMGIVKVGLAKSGEVELGGYFHDVGQPYCDIIDDADYVGDVSAKRRAAFEFEGHRYRLPTKYAKEFFGKKFADSIKPDFKLFGDRSPESIAKDQVNEEAFRTLKDYSEFYDLWLPDENVIVTLRPEGKGSRILRTVEYEGPEGGPFEVLGYNYFPETPIPVPPVYHWLDMDTMVNVLANKMKHQAERNKTVLAYEDAGAEDAENIAQTPDGGTCRVSDIDRIKEVKYGGVNEENYKWVDWILHHWSRQAYNADTLGGRSTMAETLGQEQMLLANASRAIYDMAGEVHEFTKKVIRRLAWYLWTDPLVDIPVIKRVSGLGDLPATFSQSAREGDFYDYNFDIEPYSMKRESPDMKGQKLLQFVSQWVLPTAPIAAQQGNQIDINIITKDLAKYFGVDNVDHWWKSAVPTDVRLNPYTPQKGEIKSEEAKAEAAQTGVADGRTGLMGAASRNANLMQQQTRDFGRSVKE
jgi:hypothetical protein